MNEFIKGAIILVFTYVLANVLAVFIGYFTGMGVSVSAGYLFDIDGYTIAEIFAWIGIGLANIFYVLLIADHYVNMKRKKEIEISTEALDEILKELDSE